MLPSIDANGIYHCFVTQLSMFLFHFVLHYRGKGGKGSSGDDDDGGAAKGGKGKAGGGKKG